MVVTLKMMVNGSSDEGLRAGARQVLAHVKPHWDLHNLHFKMYTEGVTNILVGVWNKTERDQVLVRVYGNNTHLFIDRQAEIATLKMVHAAECGPEVYAAFTNGLSYAFTPGVPLTIFDVHKEYVWRAVTAKMARLHTIKAGDKKKPVLFPKMRQLLALLPPSYKDSEMQRSVEEYGCTKEKLTHMVDELETFLEPLNCPVVFCHNDLVFRNIIWDDKDRSATFIDYEYADVNYQAYDIANHFNEYSGMDELDYSRYPGRDHQRMWLRSYLAHYKGVKEDDIEAAEVERWRRWVSKFTLASHLSWCVWAFLQACHSNIDFDYIRYGIARMAEFNKWKDYLTSVSYGTNTEHKSEIK